MPLQLLCDYFYLLILAAMNSLAETLKRWHIFLQCGAETVQCRPYAWTWREHPTGKSTIGTMPRRKLKGLQAAREAAILRKWEKRNSNSQSSPPHYSSDGERKKSLCLMRQPLCVLWRGCFIRAAFSVSRASFKRVKKGCLADDDSFISRVTVEVCVRFFT